MGPARQVLAPAAFVIGPLIAAAFFIPPAFPPMLRQVVLCVWGVGAMLVAERLLFGGTWHEAIRAIGFVRPRVSAVWIALLVSVPMWGFLPAFAWFSGVPLGLRPGWLRLLLGVILVNGIA